MHPRSMRVMFAGKSFARQVPGTLIEQRTNPNARNSSARYSTLRTPYQIYYHVYASFYFG